MQTDHLRSHELLLPFLGIELVTIPLDRNIFGPLALTSNKPDTQRKKQTLLHKFSTLSRRTSRAKYLDQVKMTNRKYGLSVQKKSTGPKKKCGSVPFWYSVRFILAEHQHIDFRM